MTGYEKRRSIKKLNFTVPKSKRKRVIILSDVTNEADDPFAIMHHLLTPSEEILGIIAAHNEYFGATFEKILKDKKHTNLSEEESKMSTYVYEHRAKTMECSYQEGIKILNLAGIDDVSMIRGSAYELSNLNKLPISPGADFIIEKAMNGDERPLYIAVLSSITDVAIAYLKKPEIADKIVVIWIGGSPYPGGGGEFNLIRCGDTNLFQQLLRKYCILSCTVW